MQELKSFAVGNKKARLGLCELTDETGSTDDYFQSSLKGLWERY